MNMGLGRFVGVLMIGALLSGGGVAFADDLSTPEGEYAPVIDPANFSARITNPYLPLIPGTTWVYEGETEDGAERNEVTVLDETKVVMGVECVIVHDVVYVEDEAVEDTLDWYAQDSEGNVWYFGEESKDIEEGEVVSTEGSWEAGIDGALPGIVMPGEPVVGEVYRQEYYVGEAEDMGKVLEVGASVSVPYGDYENVLVTADWNPLDPETVEHKYYAEGVGLVFEEKVEGGEEVLHLVDFIQPEAATPAA